MTSYLSNNLNKNSFHKINQKYLFIIHSHTRTYRLWVVINKKNDNKIEKLR